MYFLIYSINFQVLLGTHSYWKIMLYIVLYFLYMTTWQLKPLIYDHIAHYLSKIVFAGVKIFEIIFKTCLCLRHFSQMYQPLL